MKLKYVETVGNLRIFYDETPELFMDGFRFTVYAYNGADCQAQESFYGRPDPWTVREAVERLLYRRFDTCTFSVISAAVPKICFEYDGHLLSGKIAGFDSVEYFKRIDDTRFYKHYVTRPPMNREEYQQMRAAGTL